MAKRGALAGAGWLAAMCLGVACTDPLPPDPAREQGLEQTGAVPEPPEPGPDSAQSSLELIAPINGALIMQNDSTIGCAYHRRRGYGFEIGFRWTAVAGDTVAGYEIYAKNRDAQFPIVDHWFVDDPGLTVRSCNAFVIDRYLEGWEWKVRVVTAAGEYGPWTPVAEFAFAPCRHPDGMICTAPPGS